MATYKKAVKKSAPKRSFMERNKVQQNKSSSKKVITLSKKARKLHTNYEKQLGLKK